MGAALKPMARIVSSQLLRPLPRSSETLTVNSRKLEYGLRMIRAGIPVSIPFGGMGIRMFQLFGVSCGLPNVSGLGLKV